MAAYDDFIINEGLASYYWSFDEASSPFVDLVASNPMAFTAGSGQPSIIPGGGGSSYTPLNNATNTLATDVYGGSAGSIEFWLRPAVGESSKRLIYWGGDVLLSSIRFFVIIAPAGDSGYRISATKAYTSGGSTSYQSVDTTDPVFGGNNVLIDSLSDAHIVVTYNIVSINPLNRDSQMAIWRNGVRLGYVAPGEPYGGASGGINTGSGRFRVGYEADVGFAGLVDGLALYNQVLSEETILAHYNFEVPPSLDRWRNYRRSAERTE